MRRFLGPTLLVLGLAVVRFAGLQQFPELNPDEGLWTNSTKNFLMFGDWFMDGRKHLFLSPAFHGISLIAFSIADPAIVAARAISALLGTAAVFLLAGTVKGLSGDVQVAAVAAILFGFNRFVVLLSRQALLESTTVFFVLLAAWLIVSGRRNLGAGLVFGLALLTKTTAIAVIPAVALLAGLRSYDASRPRKTWTAIGFFLGAAIAVAAVGYIGLFAWNPERFVAAFTYELDGVHFEDGAPTLLRVGRFAVAPTIAARTVFDLASGLPFVFVLGIIGLPLAWDRERTCFWFFSTWFVVVSSFHLLQLYQPLRYFLLVLPPAAYFAATTITQLRTAASESTKRWLVPALLVIYVAYNVGGLTVGAFASPSNRLATVVEWADANAAPDDVFMAAGYFCTDLPQRAYAHYDLATSPTALLTSVIEYDIDYIVYDDTEWPAELQATLDTNFERIEDWGWGAVYRVGNGSLTSWPTLYDSPAGSSYSAVPRRAP